MVVVNKRGGCATGPRDGTGQDGRLSEKMTVGTDVIVRAVPKLARRKMSDETDAHVMKKSRVIGFPS